MTQVSMKHTLDRRSTTGTGFLRRLQPASCILFDCSSIVPGFKIWQRISFRVGQADTSWQRPRRTTTSTSREHAPKSVAVAKGCCFVAAGVLVFDIKRRKARITLGACEKQQVDRSPLCLPAVIWAVAEVLLRGRKSVIKGIRIAYLQAISMSNFIGLYVCLTMKALKQRLSAQNTQNYCKIITHERSRTGDYWQWQPLPLEEEPSSELSELSCRPSSRAA